MQGAYDEVATQLETSVNAIAVAVHRLRQRYRDLVRADVANTVAGPDDIEGELRSLFS
jgi:RNA polymerase sigma-70 factor (ECF subfamily)